MVFDRQLLTQSPEETAKLGESLADYLKQQGTGDRGQARVVCLYGDLGSGKTTFASGFAKGLGITSRLLSPTFIIVRRYDVPQTQNFLYHLDLYRIGGEQDLAGLGVSEILADSGSYVLIEWAEKLGNLLPDRRIDIRFIVKNNGRYSIIIKNF